MMAISILKKIEKQFLIKLAKLPENILEAVSEEFIVAAKEVYTFVRN